MFTIRRYSVEDIEAILNHLEQFFNENRGQDYENHYKHIDFDREKLYNHLKMNVNNVRFFLNVIEVDEEIVGGLCASVMRPFYSSDLIAYDQIIYTVPSYNVVSAVQELIKSYIRWSERRGAVECRLCSTTGFKERAFAALAKRNKFVPIGTDYARRL